MSLSELEKLEAGLPYDFLLTLRLMGGNCRRF